MMDSQETKKIYTTKEEVIDRAKEIAANEEVISREEVEFLRTAFYKILNAEYENQQKEYLEAGGDPEKYLQQTDPAELEFKAVMADVRERRAAISQQQEEERGQNLRKKLEIIEKIKNVATSPDEANKNYNLVKELQAQWKEIGSVPPENATELWRSYQHITEQFYDLLKLNIEARNYDFKKNLEMKVALCEAAEKLADEKDIISAFHQLQELHNQYREIGPVAKEQREEIWTRFKAASTVINKAHQQYFENLRAAEEENLSKKTVLCEKAEAIFELPKKGNIDWETQSKEIIALQTEWKGIGFAPQKMNVKIFERFRSACDKFFIGKAEYYKSLRASLSENAQLKRDIIEKAKALSDSTEWRSASDKLIALQNEWKKIGPVPKKLGDQLWTEFRAECDKFFEARTAATSGARQEERKNLEEKREIVAQIKALAEADEEGLQEKVQALQKQYQEGGHVPFREKDKLYKEYRAALDEAYKKIRAAGRSNRLSNFKATMAKRGDGAVDSERYKLLRSYDAIKQEIINYENNLGFLSGASKAASAIVDDITRKIEKLKADLELTREKLKALDNAGKE